MALSTARPRLWSLLIFLSSTYVTAIKLNWGLESPKNFWMDGSCIRRGFTPVTAQESLDMASRGAKRLLNLNDNNQGFIYRLLFKEDRDFEIFTDRETQAWDVVEIEGWIGSIKYEVNRDLADVRIYCDNDARWARVPDDPVAIDNGMTANSLHESDEDAEFEDPGNFMRRAVGNMGCQIPKTLGVTYDTPTPSDDLRVPRNYHKFRQTITICNLAFDSPIKKFADIPIQSWRTMRMNPLRLIPTNVLLYQLVNLEPFWIAFNRQRAFPSRDSWRRMLTTPQQYLVHKPGPTSWNAILAYVADKGWGLKQNLSPPEYQDGVNLLKFVGGPLINIPFQRVGPGTLPDWMTLPEIVWGTE